MWNSTITYINTLKMLQGTTIPIYLSIYHELSLPINMPLTYLITQLECHGYLHKFTKMISLFKSMFCFLSLFGYGLWLIDGSVPGLHFSLFIPASAGVLCTDSVSYISSWVPLCAALLAADTFPSCTAVSSFSSLLSSLYFTVSAEDNQPSNQWHAG